VKFGALRDPANTWLGSDSRPAAVKTFLAYSLKCLGTEYIDIYRPARVDPAVPIEETVGAIAEMVEAGYVRFMGLSEAGVDTLRRAQAIHPIADLQIEYSLLSRGIEHEILPVCRELGIGVTAYGVLSRGLLSGSWSRALDSSSGDFRARAPRFQGANLEHNLSLVEALRAVAKEKSTTVAQLAIAWVLSRGDDIVPIVGARRRSQLGDVLDALEVSLSDEDQERIERAIPTGAAAGERYAAPSMAQLDSEKTGSM
jgi:aryl-alcohol dehydrogenase-like predicted oxidoreductase